MPLRRHSVTLLVAAIIVVPTGLPAVTRAASPTSKDRAAQLAEARLPKPVELPRPINAVAVPDGDAPISVRLAQDPPAGSFVVRRVSAGDGKLYLGIRSSGDQPFAGEAEVGRGDGRPVRADIVDGELWLSLSPRFGKTTIRVSSSKTLPVALSTPTTLVEIRGRQIYVNGEPFLIKGAMSRNLTERDAGYVRSLGINTLRGQDALESCERFGFMSITSLGYGNTATKESMHESDAEFEATLARAMDWLRENSRAPIASPNTLIVQLGNEKTGGSAVPPGRPAPEPTARARRHVSQLLAASYNLIKPLAPGLPVGYANQDLGFLAPDCMDVYMHNSFLHKDRYGYAWDDFMRWQGCLPPDGPGGRGRPFVNSEFGANRYLAQAYHGGPNQPVLEKLHAWNFPNRWAEFMEHGTVGGAIYCLYDLEKPVDQGCSRFGILTFEGQPKLACWDVGRMWRDLEVEGRPNGELALTFKRDYRAQNCRLTITTREGKSITKQLDDFVPRSNRTIALPEAGDEFRWQLDFTTHAGLVNQARGAWPVSAEASDFLDRLKPRDTYPFLRELFDAQVVTVDRKSAPPTLAEMARPGDGIIPVALRKPSGVTYLLLISRENPAKAGGPLRDGVSLDVSFTGKVERVHDITGRPLPEPVDVAPIEGGLRLRNLQAARIPGAIGERADEPFKLPLYRITP
jgi:hypothetical protein